jgi:hypothetical protein
MITQVLQVLVIRNAKFLNPLFCDFPGRTASEGNLENVIELHR